MLRLGRFLLIEWSVDHTNWSKSKIAQGSNLLEGSAMWINGRGDLSAKIQAPPLLLNPASALV